LIGPSTGESSTEKNLPTAIYTDLQNSRDDGEAEEDRPSGLVSEDAAHAQHLGDQDGDRDDQLVDGADLKSEIQDQDSEDSGSGANAMKLRFTSL